MYFFLASKNNKKYIDFMKNNYPPGFTYQEFAPMFTAEFFDPTAWAQLFAKSGAKYANFLFLLKKLNNH